MRKGIALIVLVAFAAGAAFVVATAHAGGKSDVLTLTVYGKNREGGFVDQGPAGVSPGDIRVSNREIFDRHGNRVGRTAVVCVIVETGDDPGESVMANCNAVIKLAGGEISTSGISSYGKITDLTKTPTDINAVTGGTGVYAGVWGTEAFKLLSPTETREILTLHRR